LATVYAEHLKPFNVAAISLWPGFVGTERMTRVMESDPGLKLLTEKMGLESAESSGRVSGLSMGSRKPIDLTFMAREKTIDDR
jgi:hypothetical protein